MLNERAGLSSHQRNIAVVVANVPEAQFNKAVESDDPATVRPTRPRASTGGPPCLGVALQPPGVPVCARQGVPELTTGRAGDAPPEAVKAWWARMETKEGEAAMKRRRGIETLNGILKNRGMRRTMVRGLENVRCSVLLQALSNNLMQALRLWPMAQAA